MYDQFDAESVVAQHDRILTALTEKLPNVATRHEENRADVLARSRATLTDTDRPEEVSTRPDGRWPSLEQVSDR